jgi:hypothetical protein
MELLYYTVYQESHRGSFINSTRLMLLGISMIMLGGIITLDTTTTTGSLLIYPGFFVWLRLRYLQKGIASCLHMKKSYDS